MVIGFPSNYAIPLIEAGLLMDFTDKISDIANLHEGVVRLNMEIGNERLFTISPVITDMQLLFTNKYILDSLNLEIELGDYVSWYEFLVHLDSIQEKIEANGLDYRPLSFEFGWEGRRDTSVARSFVMNLLGSDTPLDASGLFNESAENFFAHFSEIIDRHGITSEEVIDLGGYPWDFVFSTGNFVHMLGGLSELERLLNEEFNDYHNSISMWELNIGFPVAVSFISVEGGSTQNLRETAIFINNKTQHPDVCIDILNLLMSEEYANKIIDNRFDFSHFSATYISLPTFFSAETISRINEVYDDGFCISSLYAGNVAYAIDASGTRVFTGIGHLRIFEDAFTDVLWREDEIDFTYAVRQALQNINDKLKDLNSSDN